MQLPVVGDAIPRRGNALSRLIARSSMKLCGWRIEGEIPNQPKLILVGAPHTSNWDFVLTMATLFALSVRISWMAKHTAFRWPFRRLLAWLGGVPIDRTSESGGIVEQTIQAFKANDKFVIALTPEGTRAKVRAWKTGFYHIAQGAGVPIVLIRFDHGRKVMGIGPTIQPTGDIKVDLAHIQSVFAAVRGRHQRQGVNVSAS